MTEITAERDTGARAFNAKFPVHHLGLPEIDRLVAAFCNSSSATDEERALMGGSGNDRNAIRQRFTGLTTYVERLLVRRRALLESLQWDDVAASITSRRFKAVFGDFPTYPDPNFFEVLAQALPIAESLRRSEILAELAHRRRALVEHPRWQEAIELVRSRSYQSVLTDGVRSKGSDEYISLATRAVSAGEAALRQFASTARNAAAPAPMPQGSGKKRRAGAHASARRIRRENGPQRPAKGVAVETSDKPKKKGSRKKERRQ